MESRVRQGGEVRGAHGKGGGSGVRQGGGYMVRGEGRKME